MHPHFTRSRAVLESGSRATIPTAFESPACAGATQERFKRAEMPNVLSAMRDAFSAMSVPGDDPHALLIEWGGAISSKFKVDNVHLTGTEEKGKGSEAVVTAV